ncbi:hypothetical protein CEXT_757531, partial [Caerostris extrusa]
PIWANGPEQSPQLWAIRKDFKHPNHFNILKTFQDVILTF